VTGGGSKQAKGAMKQGSRHDKLRDEVQNGEKCEVSVFRYYGTQSRAASNRRTVNSKSSLPELAHLLSAQLPVGPATFLTKFAKNGEKCKMCQFRCYGIWSGGKQQENSPQQVRSARASPVAFSPIASQPRHFSDS